MKENLVNQFENFVGHYVSIDKRGWIEETTFMNNLRVLVNDKENKLLLIDDDDINEYSMKINIDCIDSIEEDISDIIIHTNKGLDYIISNMD